MEKQEAIDRMKSDWSGLMKQHRSEVAEAVCRYCSWGLGIRDVAREIGRSHSWVQDQLDLAAADDARGYEAGRSSATPPKVEDVRAIVRKYGKEPKREEIEEFEMEGFTSEVAKRMARTYGAAEVAIEKGVLQESHKQAQEKTAAVLFGSEDKWLSALMTLDGRVKAAARTLDQANIGDLKKEITVRYVSAAHAKWMEQIERLQNFHPVDFDAEVDARSE